MNETQNSAYVFAITEQGYVKYPAAVIELVPGGGVFRYGQTWLSEGGYALDPVNLPLQDQPFMTQARGGVFGVCLDAGPDAWGRKVLLATHQRSPRNEIEFLLGCRGTGVGALRFSLARSGFLPPPQLPSLDTLAHAAAAAEAVATLGEVDDTMLNLLVPGSSLGGARPKASFRDNGTEWLVKFPRQDDLIPIPELEELWLSRASSLGLPVPRHRLVDLPKGKKALAVERFDRNGYGQPLHYLSAYALLNLHRVREADPRLSYREIAHRGRKFIEDPKAFSQELYRRMVFNAVSANTDDHTRNLGFLYDPNRKAWQLAPAFDLVPQVSNSGLQALAVGVDGRIATIQNLLSECAHFGVSIDEARIILRETAEAFADIDILMQQRSIPQGVGNRINELLSPLRQEILSNIPASCQVDDNYPKMSL